LLPGFYLNELLMRLMTRHDPHPALFDAYAQTLQAMGEPALLQAALRAFELILLRQLGHLPDLAAQTIDGQGVAAGRMYELHPELGIVAAQWVGEQGAGPVVLDGAVLSGIEHALSCGQQMPPVPAVMAACMPALSELKAVLRTLIHYHLGSQTLRTRQLMMELQQP
jgi:DNA repair protein RecO (recombination protein O)